LGGDKVSDYIYELIRFLNKIQAEIEGESSLPIIKEGLTAPFGCNPNIIINYFSNFKLLNLMPLLFIHRINLLIKSKWNNLKLIGVCEVGW